MGKPYCQKCAHQEFTYELGDHCTNPDRFGLEITETTGGLVCSGYKSMQPMHDSGKRQEFSTGAVRDTAEGKGRFDLLSPAALFRWARWMEIGAKKYDDRNWEKGIPVSRCVDSAMRHLVKYLAGHDDEDHLAAVMFNVAAIMHFEEHMPKMQDLPKR